MLADMRLAELAVDERGGALPLEEHRALAEQMRDGHLMAQRVVERISFPDDCDEFIRLLELLHRTIFRETGLTFAGRFRQPGEHPVSYGRGKHEREGAGAGSIVPMLRELFGGVFAGQDYARMEEAAVTRLCARFMEEFFRIHPFHDGNGRVARLVIRTVARRTGRFFFDRVPEHDDARRDYTKALAYAHQLVIERQYSSSMGKDPYGPLASWMRAYLRRVPDEKELQEPEDEPSWAGDDPDPIG